MQVLQIAVRGFDTTLTQLEGGTAAEWSLRGCVCIGAESPPRASTSPRLQVCFAPHAERGAVGCPSVLQRWAQHAAAPVTVLQLRFAPLPKPSW